MRKLSFICLFLISGCGHNTPDCSDQRVSEQLTNIVRNNVRNSFQGATDYLDFKLNNIRIKSHNKDVDSYVCAANIVGTLTEEQKKQAIEKEYESYPSIMRNDPVIKYEVSKYEDIINYGVNKNINYSIESINDGKDFYVEIVH